MLLSFAAFTLTLAAGWCGYTLWLRQLHVRRLLLRQQVHVEEATRAIRARQQFTAAQQAAETVVDVSNSTVRQVHQAIASIPFSILEAIPATRQTTRLVRLIHDTISGGVYESIGAVNQIIGEGLRSQIAPPKPEDKPGPP